MAITDWPVDERPREKMVAKAAGSLSDAELLAIFLRTGVRGRSAVDLARDLLARCGIAKPSHAAETLTQALALVDVRVLDHFIIAGSGVVSFAERGLI